MKNLKLTVFFIQATLESDIKHFTFITPNPGIIYEKINISQQNYEFMDFKIEVINEQNFIIHARKDKNLLTAANLYFQKNSFAKYKDFIPFDADISNTSFVNDILFNANLYQPKNELENFLASKNLLKSYYQKKLKFKIGVEVSEYSKDLGSKKFLSEYTSTEIDDDYIKDGKKLIYPSNAFSSYSTEKLLYILGDDDDGKPVSLEFHSLTKKMKP